MDILRQIDAIFEQEFTVSHEPVKSALLQTVGQVIKDVWDLDPRMGKYKNKTFQDVEREMSRAGSFKALHDRAQSLKPNIDKAKSSAKSANVDDLKKVGVNDKAAAMIQTLDHVKFEIAVKVIQLVINGAIAIHVDNLKASDRDKAIKLKKFIQEVAGKYGVDEHSVCAVVFELSEPDSQFSGFLERASAQGAEKMAAAVAKKTGE